MLNYDNGVTIRIYLDEILDEDFDDIFTNFTADINLQNADLIIDLQYVDSNKVNELFFLLRGVAGAIPKLRNFRRVILASNSFPKSLAIDKYQLSLIPRVESKVFNKAKEYFGKKAIELVYADYAVNHWSYFEFIPGMQPSFNIRYTYDDVYVAYKGYHKKRRA